MGLRRANVDGYLVTPSAGGPMMQASIGYLSVKVQKTLGKAQAKFGDVKKHVKDTSKKGSLISVTLPS
jgi:hypothetical protein